MSRLTEPASKWQKVILYKTANSEDGAQLDIHVAADNVGGNDRAYFDIRVFTCNSHAPLNIVNAHIN